MLVEIKNDLVLTRDRINFPGFFFVKEPFTVSINNINIVVPSGMKTDLASFVKLGSWITFGNKIGAHMEAAVVHDFLYKDKNSMYSRETSDKIFLEIMKYSNTRKSKRLIMYYAVRLVGWIYWR